MGLGFANIVQLLFDTVHSANTSLLYLYNVPFVNLSNSPLSSPNSCSLIVWLSISQDVMKPFWKLDYIFQKTSLWEWHRDDSAVIIFNFGYKAWRIYSSSECVISLHAEALLFAVCWGSNLPVSETMREFSVIEVCVVPANLVKWVKALTIRVFSTTLLGQLLGL